MLPLLVIAPLLSPGCVSSECAQVDCGALPEPGADADAGPGMDAGPEPEPRADAGTELEAGMDAGTEVDAGTDAGVSCLDMPHHPQLGTLSLQPGFSLAGAAPLPPGLTSLTAVPQGQGFSLYGVRGLDKALYALGTWPQLALGSSPLHYVVAPADRSRTVFLSEYLVNDGSRLLTGYLRGGSNGDGNVLVYELADPARSRYVPAPGNTSACAADGAVTSGASALFVSGAGLDTLGAPGGEEAIYALKTQSQPFQALKLAVLDPDWAAISGRSAMTAHGVAVFGYFSAWDEQEHLRAVPPAVYAQALASGTPFSLADWPEVHAGPQAGLFVAGFGQGLAVHRASVSETTGELDTLEVLRIPLALGSGPRPSVSVGKPAPVLVSQDACTQVNLLVPMGRDLLVGVSDKQGGRLVRLAVQEPLP